MEHDKVPIAERPTPNMMKEQRKVVSEATKNNKHHYSEVCIGALKNWIDNAPDAIEIFRDHVIIDGDT